jgi:hypothetical protein
MKYAAFLSYARIDDTTFSRGTITRFKSLLEFKIREITGELSLTVFHDEESIPVSSQWQDAIDKAIQHEAPVLIAAITPSYLNSDACQEELKKFLAREETLGRKDLIFPIYLVEADEMEIKNKEADEMEVKNKSAAMAAVLRQRQMVDFRQHYEKHFRSKLAHKHIAELAKRIKRVSDLITKEPVVNEPPRATRVRTRVPKAVWPPPVINYDKDILAGESTVYKVRISHFEDEKLFLAEQFGEYLLARLKRLYTDGQPVILLIDAGTTLFPFFPKLGECAIRARESVRGASSWIDNLTVITNNLTGIHWLMKHGRISPTNPWSEIALRCLLLSGIPLPAYSATTGLEEVGRAQSFVSSLMPEKLLANLLTKKRLSKNKDTGNGLPRVIALITGNWIRIRQTSPRYPVPLARGRGHLSVKQSMIDLADEVYVVSPLGKIFANHAKHEIELFLNKLVEDQKPHQPHQPQYREVKVEMPFYQDLGEEESVSQKIKLVTTYRPPDYLLSGLSSLLGDETYMSASTIQEDNYAKLKDTFAYEAGSNLMFLFDGVPNGTQEQMEAEFPHLNTRNRDFLKKFHVADSALDSLFR